MESGRAGAGGGAGATAARVVSWTFTDAESALASHPRPEATAQAIASAADGRFQRFIVVAMYRADRVTHDGRRRCVSNVDDRVLRPR